MSLAVWTGCKCWEMSVAINAMLAGEAGQGPVELAREGIPYAITM